MKNKKTKETKQQCQKVEGVVRKRISWRCYMSHETEARKNMISYQASTSTHTNTMNTPEHIVPEGEERW